MRPPGRWVVPRVPPFSPLLKSGVMVPSFQSLGGLPPTAAAAQTGWRAAAVPQVPGCRGAWGQRGAGGTGGRRKWGPVGQDCAGPSGSRQTPQPQTPLPAQGPAPRGGHVDSQDDDGGGLSQPWGEAVQGAVAQVQPGRGQRSGKGRQRARHPPTLCAPRPHTPLPEHPHPLYSPAPHVSPNTRPVTPRTRRPPAPPTHVSPDTPCTPQCTPLPPPTHPPYPSRCSGWAPRSQQQRPSLSAPARDVQNWATMEPFRGGPGQCPHTWGGGRSAGHGHPPTPRGTPASPDPATPDPRVTPDPPGIP